MRKLLPLLFIFLLLYFIYSLNKVYAWPGCCSHHGGVCGCQCCDGTPLSAKCAPHYPQCNSYSVNILQAEKEFDNYNKLDHENNAWLWLIGGGLIGYIIHGFIKKE